MRDVSPSARRRWSVVTATAVSLGLIATPAVAFGAGEDEDVTWTATNESYETGVQNGFQLAIDQLTGSVYVGDAQWRVDAKSIGTPENTPIDSGNSMRSSFSPYGVAVDPDVDGEVVIVTTTARQRDPEAGYGGGVVIYNASQGEPTDADRVFEFDDGSPVLAGPRRVVVDAQRDRAYVTNLGNSRSSQGPGFILVLDLTKRGADAVIARVGLPEEASSSASGWWANPATESTQGVVGVAVDEVNNRIYVGTMTGEKLFVIDGSQIDGSKDSQDTQAYVDAVTELDAVVGANARPAYNPDTKKVYVSAYNASTVTVVDGDPLSATYGQVEDSFSVNTDAPSGSLGTNETVVDADRGLLYSANLDAGVSVYDITNGYEQIVFTAEDGSTYRDIPLPGRSVNIELNKTTGELWVSTHANTGLVHRVTVASSDDPVVDVPKPGEPVDWQSFVPSDSDALLQLENGGLIGEQIGDEVIIKNIPVADGDWVHIFGYSTPAYLDAYLVNSGTTTVSVAGFEPGTHYLAVYDTSNEFLGYVSFVIAETDVPTPGPGTDDADDDQTPLPGSGLGTEDLSGTGLGTPVGILLTFVVLSVVAGITLMGLRARREVDTL